MNYHAQNKKNKHRSVALNDGRNLLSVPRRPYLSHHLRCRFPSHLIGLGGVEVGACSEEEACECYKDKGLRYGPRPLEPTELPRGTQGIVETTQRTAQGYDAQPNGPHSHHRPFRFHGHNTQHHCAHHCYERTPMNANGCPRAPDEHAQTIETAPDHKVPAGTVPETTEQHGVHSVHIAGYALLLLGV